MERCRRSPSPSGSTPQVLGLLPGLATGIQPRWFSESGLRNSESGPAPWRGGAANTQVKVLGPVPLMGATVNSLWSHGLVRDNCPELTRGSTRPRRSIAPGLGLGDLVEGRGANLLDLHLGSAATWSDLVQETIWAVARKWRSAANTPPACWEEAQRLPDPTLGPHGQQLGPFNQAWKADDQVCRPRHPLDHSRCPRRRRS